MDLNLEDSRAPPTRRGAPLPSGMGLGTGLRRVAARFVGTLRGPTAAPSSASRVRGLPISPPLETLPNHPSGSGLDIWRANHPIVNEQSALSAGVPAAVVSARTFARLPDGASGASVRAQQLHYPPQHPDPPAYVEDAVDMWPTSASILPAPDVVPTFDLLASSELYGSEHEPSPVPLNVLLIGEDAERSLRVDLLGSPIGPSPNVSTGAWRRHSLSSLPSPTTSLAESYSYTIDSLSVDGASGGSRSISGLSRSTGNGSSSSSSKSSRATSFRTRSTPSALSLVGPWRANLLSDTASRSSNGLRLYDLNEEAGDEDAAGGRPLLPMGTTIDSHSGPRIVSGHSFSAASAFTSRSQQVEGLSLDDQFEEEPWSASTSPAHDPASHATGARRAAISARRRLIIANAAPTDRHSTSTIGSSGGVAHPRAHMPDPTSASGSSLRRAATLAGAANRHAPVAPVVPPIPATLASGRGQVNAARRVLFVANRGPSDRGRGGGAGSSSGSSSSRSKRSTWSSASSGAAAR